MTAPPAGVEPATYGLGSSPSDAETARDSGERDPACPSVEPVWYPAGQSPEEEQALVEKIASIVGARYHLPPSLRPELIADGWVGLCEARRSFRWEGGAAFTTWAFYRVRGAILDGIRRRGFMPSDMHRAGIGVAAVSAALAHELAKPPPTPEELLRAKRVSEALAKLPRRERQLVELVTLEGQDLSAVSRRLHVSCSWASRLHRAALQRIALELKLVDRRRSVVA